VKTWINSLAKPNSFFRLSRLYAEDVVDRLKSIGNLC